MKFTDYTQEADKNPEFAEAKEALKLQFALGDAVIRARIQRGWSQTELAAQVGTKQANISRIEAGLANPTIKLVQRIIHVLDLEVYFAPAITSTSSAIVSFDSGAIAVHDWPENRQDATTTTQKMAELREDPS